MTAFSAENRSGKGPGSISDPINVPGRMDYEEIRKYLDNCYFSEHARREMEAEPFGIIRVDDVSYVLRTGEIIEEYPEDTPGDGRFTPSVLRPPPTTA
jgi:hypothetical protein